jgi:hypothetical protein
MSDLFINLQDEIDRQIVFAVVNPKATGVYLGKDGITYFPSKADLIQYRLGKHNVISIQELPDKKCKLCYGTGKLGVIVMPSNIYKTDIFDILVKYLDEDANSIPGRIMELMKLPPNLEQVLKVLVDVAQSELTDHNLQAISTKYSKIIADDFKPRQQQWCSCFLKAYKKAVEETRRAIKFGVN